MISKPLIIGSILLFIVVAIAIVVFVVIKSHHSTTNPFKDIYYVFEWIISRS